MPHLQAVEPYANAAVAAAALAALEYVERRPLCSLKASTVVQCGGRSVSGVDHGAARHARRLQAPELFLVDGALCVDYLVMRTRASACDAAEPRHVTPPNELEVLLVAVSTGCTKLGE